MLAAARRRTAARNLIGDTAHRQRIKKFLQKQILINAFKRRAHEAIDRLFRDHDRKIIDFAVSVLLLKDPVIESCNLRHHIADSGIQEFLRRTFDNLRVDHDSICQTRRNGLSVPFHEKRRTRTGKSVTGSRGRNTDKSEIAQKTAIFCRIDDLTTPDADDRLCLCRHRKSETCQIFQTHRIQFLILKHIHAGFFQ